MNLNPFAKKASGKRLGRPPKVKVSPEAAVSGTSPLMEGVEPGLVTASSAAIARVVKQESVMQITADEISTLKATIAHDLNDSEFKLFLFECHRRGAHPLSRLIHPVKRQGKVTFQTSIDYLRSRAESSGSYDGQNAPVYAYKSNGSILSATVTVYRKGMGRGISATAFFDEYKPAPPNDFMWNKMGHVMIAKCAECLALRKGWPEELAGLYAREEMGDNAGVEPEITTNKPSKPVLQEPKARKVAEPITESATIPKESAPDKPESTNLPAAEPEPTKPVEQAGNAQKQGAGIDKGDKISEKQAKRLFAMLMGESVRTLSEFREYLKTNFGIERTDDVNYKDLAKIEQWILVQKDSDYKKLLEEVLKILKDNNLKEAEFVGMATKDACSVAGDCSWVELLDVRKQIKGYIGVGKKKQ